MIASRIGDVTPCHIDFSIERIRIPQTPNPYPNQHAQIVSTWSDWSILPSFDSTISTPTISTFFMNVLIFPHSLEDRNINFLRVTFPAGDVSIPEQSALFLCLEAISISSKYTFWSCNLLSIAPNFLRTHPLRVIFRFGTYLYFINSTFWYPSIVSVVRRLDFTE